MESLALLARFEESYLQSEAYPTNLLFDQYYDDTLLDYKRRLDSAESTLFSSKNETSVSFRDYAPLGEGK